MRNITGLSLIVLACLISIITGCATVEHVNAYADYGDIEKVKSLLDRNPSLINASDNRGYTPLYSAVRSEKTEVAIYLILRGADVNAKEYYLGLTPLHEAESLEVAALLISKGADVHAKTDHNQTTLHWAAFSGSRKIAELLISRGANAQVKDKQGYTPLEVALKNGQTKVVELLRKHGAKE